MATVLGLGTSCFVTTLLGSQSGGASASGIRPAVKAALLSDVSAQTVVLLCRRLPRCTTWAGGGGLYKTMLSLMLLALTALLLLQSGAELAQAPGLARCATI